MGQIFCALVFFIVILRVKAHHTHTDDESLCSQDHPLHPFIKLFDVIPEEWKLDNAPKKKQVCFTQIITIETDQHGKEINKFSSYEISFGLPPKYKNSVSKLPISEEEYDIFPPFEDKLLNGDITTRHIVNVRCSKDESEGNERRNGATTSSVDITTNPDLDFMSGLEEICDEELDIGILDTLPSDEVTSGPDTENTRRFGGTSIEGYTESTEPEMRTTSPEPEMSKLAEMLGITSNGDMETELTEVITEILGETTTEGATTPFSIVPFEEGQRNNPTVPTQIPINIEVEISNTDEIRKNAKHGKSFIVQLKNIVAMNVEPECYKVASSIKYGKCQHPMLPIRILTESLLPTYVKRKFVKNLEEHRKDDEVIVSGKKHCYLLKHISNTECPRKLDDLPAVLQIDDLPESENDDNHFTVSLDGKCVAFSKEVGIIECPDYQHTLPNLKTDHLPDHVRFRHYPGEVDVHPNEIVVHSFSHCLLLKTLPKIKCNRADIALHEYHPKTYTEEGVESFSNDDDDNSLPNFRLGDYSFEKFSNGQRAEENTNRYDHAHMTTPCDSEDEDFKFNRDRTTRTLDSPTTTISPISTRRRNIGHTRRTDTTIPPTPPTITTTEPVETVPPTIIAEVKIPNSRKLSNLLKIIVDETVTEYVPYSASLFTPDFIVKIACAKEESHSGICFYVSKYIMLPPHDIKHEFKAVIDQSQFPSDVKIVATPNLTMFGANETIYAAGDKDKFVLIKKEKVDCPGNDKESFFILDTGSCLGERRDELIDTRSMVQYKKGTRVYCFDFDASLKLHLIKCPEDLTKIPVLARPEDLKTLCRSQLKSKNHHEQMNLLRRLNIVTDYN